MTLLLKKQNSICRLFREMIWKLLCDDAFYAAGNQGGDVCEYSGQHQPAWTGNIFWLPYGREFVLESAQPLEVVKMFTVPINPIAQVMPERCSFVLRETC